MPLKRSAFFGVTTYVGLFFSIFIALPSNAEDISLEEMVVSATRDSQDSFEIPVSVSKISQSTLFD